MHPPYYAMHGFHRGPSRIVWFILGGVAATWWMKHKQMRSQEQFVGHCVRKPIQGPPPVEYNDTAPPTSALQDEPRQFHWSWSNNHGPNQGRWMNHNAQHQPQPPQPQYEAQRSSSPPINLPFGWSQQDWEEEKEKMWAMGRQAGDTMSEMTEIALENAISTVEALKAKLADHRSERERQRQAFEQEMEQQKKEPRHYV